MDTGDCILDVRVQPGARKDEVLPMLDGVVRIRVAAPPVEGAANKQLVKFLARLLHISKSSVSVIRGESSRNKSLSIRGLTREEVQTLLYKAP